MNLQEIITQPQKITDPKVVANRIKTRCQKWFSEGGGVTSSRILYRGTLDNLGDAVIMPVRRDRRSMNTRPEITKVWNDAITKSGRVANRKNAVFATGSKDVAFGYGLGSDESVYVLFPLGSFKYTWSVALQDWFTKLFDLFTWEERDQIEEFSIYYPDNPPSVIDEKLIPSLRGDDQSMAAAIVSENEIMIHCREVLMISVPFYRTKVLPLLTP